MSTVQSEALPFTSPDTSPDASPVVEASSFLTLHYRMAGPDGADIINTFGGKPATLSLGGGQLSPAIEQRLMGLLEGTHTTFELAAGEAFGEASTHLAQATGLGVGRGFGRDEQDAFHPRMIAGAHPKQHPRRTLVHCRPSSRTCCG